MLFRILIAVAVWFIICIIDILYFKYCHKHEADKAEVSWCIIPICNILVLIFCLCWFAEFIVAKLHLPNLNTLLDWINKGKE